MCQEAGAPAAGKLAPRHGRACPPACRVTSTHCNDVDSRCPPVFPHSGTTRALYRVQAGTQKGDIR